MEELIGKYVNVVLAIEMGRGMRFIEHPVKIVANFHGRPLESDQVDPDENLAFNTELVWEIEKKELRKMRTKNIPLKVELQVIDGNNCKDRMGFILLSTRSANIISHNNMEIPFKWFKLLGVPAEHKRHRPELYMSLTIRDLALEEEAELSYLSELTLNDSERQEPPFYMNGELITFQYLPDGYIQIGNDSCVKKYLLTIIIQFAYNLDLLLQKVLVPSHNGGRYFMSFAMFGITITSKSFSRDLHDRIPMNEKIVVRIRSDYQIIRTYLSDYCQIFVTLYSDCHKLGVTKLNVDSLLSKIEEEEFVIADNSVMCEQKCFFTSPSEDGLPKDGNDRRPGVDVLIMLKQNDGHHEVVSDHSFEDITEPIVESTMSMMEANDNETTSSLREEGTEVCHTEDSQKGCGDDQETTYEKVENSSVSADGDQLKCITYVEPSSQNLETFSFKTTSSNPMSESCRSSQTTLPIQSAVRNSEINGANVNYQQYCLDVIVDNISLKRPIKSRIIKIKFKHPKAASVVTIDINTESCIGEDIILENAKCKMFFISTKDHMRKMVYAWPPKLLLTDELDQMLTEELDIYTALFLSKERYDCSYMTECKTIRTFESLAKVSITMYLQEYGLSVYPDQTDYVLHPAILDENIVIQELQELQIWKNQQKAQYTADLKLLQKQRLAALQEDWSEKKNNMEEKLAKSVNKCETLTLELQNAINSIRTKKALEQKEEEMALRENCSLQDILGKNSLKYSESNKNVLISIISKLEYENKNLKHIISDQRLEIEQVQKTALTKEQTASLLQQLRGLEEKFEDAQKAKMYFKDEWKKAVREIHDLKSEDQKQIKEKIQTQKIELSQLSLESFLSDHRGKRNFDPAQSIIESFK